MKLTKELTELKYQLGILESTDCTESESEQYRKLLIEGSPLPKGVYVKDPEIDKKWADFHIVTETKLSKEALNDYIQYKQLSTLLTIKKCVVFFTVLTIISLVFGVIAGLAISW